MITALQSLEAEKLCRQERIDLSRLLQVDQAKASPEDQKLIERVLASRKDGVSYDKALADAAVNGLFRRGVLYFGEQS